LYAYPLHLTDAVLAALASDPRFCPYLDLPLQHISDAMLAAMGRGMTKAATLALLDCLPEKLPGLALRTSFIVGYPGETEQDFEELLAFVREGRFAHAGVFLYSHEAKTPAAKLDDNLPLAVKQARRDALMAAQHEVSRRRQAARIGQKITVLVDERVDAVSGRIPEKRPEVASSRVAPKCPRASAPLRAASTKPRKWMAWFCCAAVLPRASPPALLPPRKLIKAWITKCSPSRPNPNALREFMRDIG
jgi:ribosomal protein S12 methylthiotransferase